MLIKKAINHFLDFHKGTVNIVLHVIGFAGLFYSIYKLSWILFAFFLIVLELGHIYNHIAGIKKYDLRLKVNFWRVIIFIFVVVAFYFFGRFI